MTRSIRKSRARASREAAELLAAVFASELVSPSNCIWLVSPWISDVPILDNSAATFDHLAQWGPRQVRLSEVLVTLAGLDSAVVIGSTEAESNRYFLARIRQLFDERGLTDRLTIDLDKSNELHEKAITTDECVVFGSMNITINGIFVREEFVELRTDHDFVARSKMDAYDRFGGRL